MQRTTLVVFMTRDFDPWPFDPKISEFQELIVKHLCVKFAGPSSIISEISCRKTDTHRQTEVKPHLPRLPSAEVIMGLKCHWLEASPVLKSRRVGVNGEQSTSEMNWTFGTRLIAVT